ncbi:MAG: hypothetical protein ACREJQ_02275 [bacterium]
MKRAGWLAVLAMAVVAVGVWYFTRPQPVPPLTPISKPPASEKATSATENETTAAKVEELAVNPAPADGSELMVIKRPFKDITVYPGIHLGDKVDDVRAKLSQFGIRYEDSRYPVAVASRKSLAYRAKGKILGMPDDMPMRVFLVSDHEHVLYFTIRTDDEFFNEPREVEKLWRDWNSKLDKMLGSTIRRKSISQAQRVIWCDPDDPLTCITSDLGSYKAGDKFRPSASLGLESERKNR